MLIRMSRPTTFKAFMTLDLIDLPLILLPSVGWALIERSFDLPPHTGTRALAGVIGALLVARRALIGWPKVPPKTKARSTLIEIFALVAGVIGALFLLVHGLAAYRSGGGSSAAYAAGGLAGMCAGIALYRINRRPAEETPADQLPRG